ncbi:transmembrane 4 L6 family member 4 isoform X1 [Prionailurus viverrinus]|uniref:transmembrane 4 L6 family member 4 isoform X1 n=1 Tax=Prionailurus viverrinus TaxID=61388 RepID=UPI001FF24CC8|nr:transmembrane 4 L6 family member 4 isoform X1 [Prionailurus viverrinus]
MCTGDCAKCLGGTLIPLALFGFLANILLFFPGGKVIDNNDHLSEEVWFFGGILGSGVLMIFPALVFLGLKNNDCCGCCGNESCGKRFAMFTSTIFAVIGFLGAGYSFVISAISINRGPKCLMDNSTWGYPFHDGRSPDASLCHPGGQRPPGDPVRRLPVLQLLWGRWTSLNLLGELFSLDGSWDVTLNSFFFLGLALPICFPDKV